MILNINFCFYLKFKIGLNFFLNLNGLKWVYLFIYSLTYEYKYIFYFYKIKNVLIFFELKSLLWLWKVLAEHIISCFKVRQIKIFFKVCFGEFWGKNRKFDTYIKWFNKILNAFLPQPSCWVFDKTYWDVAPQPNFFSSIFLIIVNIKINPKNYYLPHYHKFFSIKYKFHLTKVLAKKLQTLTTKYAFKGIITCWSNP